eukprot:363239-Chlamydomonas_euryale.AAC.17
MDSKVDTEGCQKGGRDGVRREGIEEAGEGGIEEAGEGGIEEAGEESEGFGKQVRGPRYQMYSTLLRLYVVAHCTNGMRPAVWNRLQRLRRLPCGLS